MNILFSHTAISFFHWAIQFPTTYHTIRALKVIKNNNNKRNINDTNIWKILHICFSAYQKNSTFVTRGSKGRWDWNKMIFPTGVTNSNVTKPPAPTNVIDKVCQEEGRRKERRRKERRKEERKEGGEGEKERTREWRKEWGKGGMKEYYVVLIII